MLGTQTHGGRMEGTDASTELWRHPTLLANPHYLVYSCFDLVKIPYLVLFMSYHVQYEIRHLSALILCLYWASDFHHYHGERSGIRTHAIITNVLYPYEPLVALLALLSSVTRLCDFRKFFVSNFHLKVAQMYGDFLGLFKILFWSINCFWAYYGIFLSNF